MRITRQVLRYLAEHQHGSRQDTGLHGSHDLLGRPCVGRAVLWQLCCPWIVLLGLAESVVTVMGIQLA